VAIDTIYKKIKPDKGVYMPSKVSDFLQGVRNCPPEIIPYHCSNCSIQDTRNNQFRNPLKPRCAEPNFAGRAVLEGVNDKGFDHENILFAFNPASSPPFYCVCGRHEFKITFSQIDKWHFPLVALVCNCGRSKTIIIHTSQINLTGAWMGQKTRKGEWESPPDTRSAFGTPIVCGCKKKTLSLYYERSGFAFYPAEGETILLGCSRCRRSKKIILHADIDASEPWLSTETTEGRGDIVVRTTTEMCPDVRVPGEQETLFVLPLAKK
jgi:hypothetical protein